MTVAELIALLQQQPQDDSVLVCLDDTTRSGKALQRLGDVTATCLTLDRGARVVAICGDCTWEREVEPSPSITRAYAEAQERARKAREEALRLEAEAERLKAPPRPEKRKTVVRA